MQKKLAYIHTVPSLVALFHQLSKEILPPEVEVFHIADEILLKVVLAQGGLSPFIYRRIAEHIAAAEFAGATAVQLTCSSISPCADACQPMAGIPVLKVDEPMVDQAIKLGERIGVVATAPTTLKPTSDLVQLRAQQRGKEVQVDSLLAEAAFVALMAGEPEKHDQIVRQSIKDLMIRNQVVILAQASMARVLESMLPEDLVVPVLSSPRLAVEHASQVLHHISM